MSIKPLKILICGGGVAGQAAAFWLADAGHRVTVVERFPALRAGGAQVDLRGQGIEAIERMGLLDAVRSKLTHEPGVRFVNRRGRALGTILANTSGRGRQSLTSEFEIMRGDLVRILHEATAARADYRFGLSVDSFDETPDAVTAHFSDGRSERFDVLIGADGQGSRVRHAILPADEDPYRRLGIHMGYFFIPRGAGDTDMRETYLAPGGRMIFRRSHNAIETQVYLILRETSPEASAVHRKPVDEQKRFWADRFRDAGWQTPRFIRGMAEAANFYSAEALQVRTHTWSRGRVVLVGDAAHCASPFSGMGISGGLVGAYVLARQLISHADDLASAFENYDSELRPFADEIQAGVKPAVLRLAMPEHSIAVGAIQAATSAACALRIPSLVERRATQDRGGAWRLPPTPARVTTASRQGAQLRHSAG